MNNKKLIGFGIIILMLIGSFILGYLSHGEIICPEPIKITMEGIK